MVGSQPRALVQSWIARRHPWTSGPLTVNRRRIYILPTRYGVLYGAMLMVMLLGAMNYSNSMAFVVCFLLLGLALVSMYHTHQNLLGLEIAAAGADPVFCGRQAAFRLRVRNPGALWRQSIQIENPGGGSDNHHIPAGAHVIATLRVRTHHRGWLQAPRFVISTVQPLGLFRAWTWLPLQMRCLVYPSPAERTAPAEGALPDVSGSREQSRHGTDDFQGLRDYQWGDSYRHIAWRVVAREQGLATKQFAELAGAEYWLDFALLAPWDEEQRLRILCRQILDLDAQGHRYGLRLPGLTVEPADGAEHRRRCLGALALHGQGAGGVVR